MSTGWQVVAVGSVLIYLLKAAAPVMLGERELPAWVTRSTTLLPAALLAALIAASTFGRDGRLVVDAQAVGLAAAAVALWRRQNFIVVVVAAAAATAIARALS